MGMELSRDELTPGIWDDDINKHPGDIYTFEHCGYNCSIERNKSSWTWCGYVTLPANHPDFCKDCDRLEKIIEVHGDLTFGENGTFGFDTHHIRDGDMSPGDETTALKDGRMAAMMHDTQFISGRGKHYWTFEQVKEEVKRMAEQFKKREC